MAWRCTGSTNAELISNLTTRSLLTSPLLSRAMLAVDRAHYCPQSTGSAYSSGSVNPYEDSPQSIGHGATISAPHMHAAAAEALLEYIGPGCRVLDVGSGSGYLCHVFARAIQEKMKEGTVNGNGNGNGNAGREVERTEGVDRKTDRAHVYGVDHIPALVELAKANMARSADGRGFLAAAEPASHPLASTSSPASPTLLTRSSSSTVAVSFLLADGRLGLPAHAPFDAIHVGAAAAELHAPLLEQLRAPGRMFIPVEEEGMGGIGDGQWVWTISKDEKGVVKRERGVGVRYVPLTGR